MKALVNAHWNAKFITTIHIESSGYKPSVDSRRGNMAAPFVTGNEQGTGFLSSCSAAFSPRCISHNLTGTLAKCMGPRGPKQTAVIRDIKQLAVAQLCARRFSAIKSSTSERQWQLVYTGRA